MTLSDNDIAQLREKHPRETRPDVHMLLDEVERLRGTPVRRALMDAVDAAVAKTERDAVDAVADGDRLNAEITTITRARDGWKNRALDAERALDGSRRHLEAAQARIADLEATRKAAP